MGSRENRVAKLEKAMGGRPGALVSVVLGISKTGVRRSQEELDLLIEREDRRIALARGAAQQTVVVRIGARVKGWRERLAARRAQGERT